MKTVLYTLLFTPFFFISSCEKPDSEEINDLEGCTDYFANNYNPHTVIDDGSCTYDPIEGCTDESACNYDMNANTNDGSCIYPEDGYDCNGHILVGTYAHGGIVIYVNGSGEHGLVMSPNDLINSNPQSNIHAPYDQYMFSWNCGNIYEDGINPYFVDGADDFSIGSGLQNTLDISNSTGTCFDEWSFDPDPHLNAAQACLEYSNDGYSDWYLPSYDELRRMEWANDEPGNYGLAAYYDVWTGDGDHPIYWSSTEANDPIFDDYGFWDAEELAYVFYFCHGGYPCGSGYLTRQKTNYARVRAVRSF